MEEEEHETPNTKQAPTVTDEAFLREALALAVENARSGEGGPFAALVVRGGEVLGRGTNRVTARHDPTAHAEVEAIRAACMELGGFQLDGCVLYASCEPCPMCLGAIYWSRLDRVVYAGTRQDAAAAGFDDALIYDELGRPPQARRIPMTALLREEAGRPFQAWAEAEDRTAY